MTYPDSIHLFSVVDEGHPPWTLSTCVDDFGRYVYTAGEKRRHLLFCFMLVKKLSRVFICIFGAKDQTNLDAVVSRLEILQC